MILLAIFNDDHSTCVHILLFVNIHVGGTFTIRSGGSITVSVVLDFIDAVIVVVIDAAGS